MRRERSTRMASMRSAVAAAGARLAVHGAHGVDLAFAADHVDADEPHRRQVDTLAPFVHRPRNVVRRAARRAVVERADVVQRRAREVRRSQAGQRRRCLAQMFAKRAQAGLKPGTPEWVKADDILNFKPPT